MMPWFRLNDKAWSSTKLRAVGKPARGGLMMLWAYAAFETTDGWLPAYVVEQEVTPDELQLLVTVRMNGRAGLLHAFGEVCDCLVGRRWTEEMGGYWIHDFVAGGNPSRAEHDVRQAKARELRDRDLLLAVRERDGNACRYCGHIARWSDRKSPRRLTYDHVDPTRAGGLDNLVVACMVCNQRKAGVKTPEAAGLQLLPPPAGRPPAGGWTPGAKRPIKRSRSTADLTLIRRESDANLTQNQTEIRREPEFQYPTREAWQRINRKMETAWDQDKQASGAESVTDHQNARVRKVSAGGRVGSGVTTDAGTATEHPSVPGQLSILDA